MRRELFAVLFLLTASLSCWATVVGNFDSLDALIQRADTIAVIRIEAAEPNANRQQPDIPSHVYQCYVYQTLKGDLPAGQTVPLRLSDTTSSFREKFRRYSTHLVFFRKHSKDDKGVGYDSLMWEGANIEVSPFGNETVPAGKSVKDRIKRLIQTYVAYREQEAKREDVLLHKFLTP